MNVIFLLLSIFFSQTVILMIFNDFKIKILILVNKFFCYISNIQYWNLIFNCQAHSESKQCRVLSHNYIKLYNEEVLSKNNFKIFKNLYKN